MRKIIENKTIGTPGKDYWKKLQRDRQRQNKKYRNARSVLTKIDAGNVEYNNSMFNRMNTPVGKPINPFTSDGGSILNTGVIDSASADTSVSSADSAGGDIGFSGGESLSISDAWEKLNKLDD